MRKEVAEVRNLALRKKEDLKYKKIEFKKGDDTYHGVWKGFGTKSLKFEIFLSYDDLLEHKDDRALEKEIWERLFDEYSNRQH